MSKTEVDLLDLVQIGQQLFVRGEPTVCYPYYVGVPEGNPSSDLGLEMPFSPRPMVKPTAKLKHLPNAVIVQLLKVWKKSLQLSSSETIHKTRVKEAEQVAYKSERVLFPCVFSKCLICERP